MVRDLIGETARRLQASGPTNADAVRSLANAGRGFLATRCATTTGRLKRFLFERMYRHPRVNRMASKARRVVRELFQLFLAEPECLPAEWARACRSERGRAGADRSPTIWPG